jgi:outer membrane protein TolC
VLKTRQFIRATESAVNSFENHLSVGKKRLEGGTLLKSDLLDIEVRLAQAREDLVRARNANTLADRALRDLLGIEKGEFAVAATAPMPSVPDVGDFSRRPELIAASEAERAARAELRSAKSGYQPRVTAFGSLDRDYGWVTGRDGNSYTAGVMLQWDLWDGFSTRAKAREASANIESMREEQRKLRVALDFETERARLDLKAANQRLAVTEKSIEQAEESAKLTRNRFEQGLALSTQLIDSETALVAARVRRAEAEYDQRIGIAALRKALALPQLDSPPILE